MEFRIQVANHLGIGWEKLEIEKLESKLANNLNGLTLTELSFKNNEKIKITKKN
jgi:hypothetical protein